MSHLSEFYVKNTGSVQKMDRSLHSTAHRHVGHCDPHPSIFWSPTSVVRFTQPWLIFLKGAGERVVQISVHWLIRNHSLIFSPSHSVLLPNRFQVAFAHRDYLQDHELVILVRSVCGFKLSSFVTYNHTGTLVVKWHLVNVFMQGTSSPHPFTVRSLLADWCFFDIPAAVPIITAESSEVQQRGRWTPLGTRR